jgi:PAS domain S-box-containing protein
LVHSQILTGLLTAHSSHPRDLPEHVEFSFMDLVYPEDQALVMSMWNNLTQGKSVTFEMRWKARAGTSEAAQWVLSACVPVFDDNNKLVAIAGNTIDISAQKRSQEAAQEKVEALEQVRLAEMKFARFAQLSPTAIYVFVPESGWFSRRLSSYLLTGDAGMNFVNDQFFELTGHARAPVNQLEWFDLIADDDVDKVKENWNGILQGDRSDGVQFRLKKTWIDQDGQRSNIWVQSASYPEIDENGKVISMMIVSWPRRHKLTYIGIMGTLFDISQFKWAESVQRRRIEEAWEAKRQQEKYVTGRVSDHQMVH